MHNASECWTTVSRTAGRRAAAASAAPRAAGSATRFTRTPPWGRINSSPIIGCDSFPRKHETHETESRNHETHETHATQETHGTQETHETCGRPSLGRSSGRTGGKRSRTGMGG